MLSRILAAPVLLVALSLAVIPLAVPANAADPRPNPSDPSVAVPATEYKSAFTAYRKAAFDEKADWKQVNNAVQAIGGHAGAMKDGPRDQPAAPAMNHGGHSGHGGHGQ